MARAVSARARAARKATPKKTGTRKVLAKVAKKKAVPKVAKKKPVPKVAKKKPVPKATRKKAAAKPFRMPPTDQATQAALDQVLGARPELRPGKMFGCPGYFVGAKAVACVFGAEVCLTLPPPQIDALVTTPGYRRFEARGRTMSGWMLLERPKVTAAESQPLFERAIEYARAKASG